MKKIIFSLRKGKNILEYYTVLIKKTKNSNEPWEIFRKTYNRYDNNKSNTTIIKETFVNQPTLFFL